MNIELKKINWAAGQSATEPQIMTLEVRKQIESNYTVITDGLQVLSDGTIFNPPTIKGLEENTGYVFRVSNNNPAGGQIEMVFNTPQELTTTAVTKKYYHNSELIYAAPGGGFRDATLPPKVGAYYSLENTLADWFGNYTPAVLTGTPVWQKANDLIGMKISGTTDKIEMPSVNLPLFTSKYGVGVHFFVAAADLPTTGEWPLLSCETTTGNGVYIYVDAATKKVHWRQKNGNVTEEIISTNVINTDSWNKVVVFRAANIALSQLWLNYFNTFTGSFSIASVYTVTTETDALLVGREPVNNSVATGGIFRSVYYTTVDLDNNIAGKYQDPPYPVGILENPADSQDKYRILRKNMIVLNNDRIVCTVPPDAPVGVRKFYIENSSGVTAPVNIEILAMTKAAGTLAINFATDTNAATLFQQQYFGMAKAWGGANGGVSPENVYLQNNTLVFEAHGDLYDGTLQGYNRDGSLKIHDIPQDPAFGEPWTKRVGAVISSKEYCGYGRYIVEAKLPTDIGVAPAFWTFHYGEVYPQDPRYEQLLAQGLHRQGSFGDGYYVVENNEIDIELPSHNSMYVFATTAEMITPNYNIVWAGEKVAVAEDPDPSKNGTWQLTNAAAPNLLSSWTKINDEIQLIYQPRKDNMKCNNWKGELGAGNGFTFGTDPFQDEFFAMLTSIGKNVWDGTFHEFRFDWYANRVAFFVDGQQVQVNTHFVPDVPGRWTLGLWFPSQPDPVKPWLVRPTGGWAGSVANWKYQKMFVKRISHEPFSDAVAGGTNRLVGETYPFDGYKNFE
jgi:hypothetical protein